MNVDAQAQAQAPAIEAEPTFQRVQTVLGDPAAGDRSMVALLIVLAVLAYTSGGVTSALVLLSVLAARDVFRLGVMKATGSVDSRLFVLPLARGSLPIGQPAGQEAIGILAGPLFLLLLSAVAFVVERVAQVQLAHEVALTSMGLAAFFLLPLKPYDGWKVLNLCLFSRWEALETAVAVVTSLALAALAVALEAWVIVVVAVLQLFGIGWALKVQRAARVFRERAGQAPAVDTEKLEEPALRMLYDATRDQFAAAVAQQAVKTPELAAKTLVTFMREVHARAARPPVTLGTTVVLLLVYGALVTYFVVGLVVAVMLTRAPVP